jgi:hypothetical protein
MTGLSDLISIDYVRSNSTNSVPYELTIKIKATNYIELFDILALKLPVPLLFTNLTECRGDNFWTKGPMLCNITDDFKEVAVNMSINGRYNTYYRKL